MTDELKVGDRVEGQGSHRTGTIYLEKETDRLMVSWDNGNCPQGVSYSALTRIEPAVPQGAFSVGQEVRIKDGGCSLHKVLKRNLVFFYEVQDIGEWPEDELEAVPDCPPCGGKVGDA